LIKTNWFRLTVIFYIFKKVPLNEPSQIDTNVELNTPVNSLVRIVGNKCHTCNRTFSRLFDLQVHIKTVHLKLKRYKCTICNYACYFRTKLNWHVATIHGKQADLETVENLDVKEQVCQNVDPSKINKSQCHICKRIFAGEFGVRTHIRAVHSQVKPHKCAFYDFRCFYQYTLAKHMKLHKKKSGNRTLSLKPPIENADEPIVSDKVNRF
jgi:uncharacterized Zn-finger protein